MMEVGNMASYNEDRAHFAAWCITSSPLILGLDLINPATVDKVWDIVSNQEAIAINQARVVMCVCLLLIAVVLLLLLLLCGVAADAR